MVILVLVIGILVSAVNVLQTLFGAGAMIAQAPVVHEALRAIYWS